MFRLKNSFQILFILNNNSNHNYNKSPPLYRIFSFINIDNVMHAYERLKILFRALQRGSKFCRTFIDTNRDTTNTKILNPCT